MAFKDDVVRRFERSGPGRALHARSMRGDAYECPCCGGTWKAMDPHRQRENVRCPGCGSLERHRLIWLFWQNETSLLDKPASVLHFAPEPVFADLLSQRTNLTYLSGDLRPGAAMEVLDITDVGHPDASFDVVICNHVFEHVPDDARAMSEVARVLKPGGVLYTQHPIDFSLEKTYEDPSVTDPAERLREFGQEDHVRWYGQDFPDRLRAAGFEIAHRRYADELPAERRHRYAIPDDSAPKRGGDIFVASKPGVG